jgi:hypothetical protein
VLLGIAGCRGREPEVLAQSQALSNGIEQIAQLEDEAVTESSGVAASRMNPGVYWTHNDSGSKPLLFAFDRTGASRGRWQVTGARNIDWEDIAIGPGPVKGRPYIYIGDIGDNSRARKEVVVYRIEEPRVRAAPECANGCVTAIPTKRATAFRLRYPDGPHDAEALLVHPSSGDVYIISKAHPGDSETRVYVTRAKNLGASAALAPVATLEVPDALFRNVAGGITGGDISPDGRHLALSDYFRVYQTALPEGVPFDDIWGRRFSATLAGISLQVEGAGFRLDGKAVIATSEGKPCKVFELPSEPR